MKPTAYFCCRLSGCPNYIYWSHSPCYCNSPERPYSSGTRLGPLLTIKPKSVIRPTYSNILLLLYGLFVRFAFLFAVLLPVPSRHSPLCLRRNGCNTT